MTAIFHELIEDSIEVFMDDFSIFGSSFDHYLKNLEKMLKRYEETNLVLNWEKCHFMVKEGIVFRHKVSGSGIEVDKAKIEAISKLPYLTNVKANRSFIGHADHSGLRYLLTKQDAKPRLIRWILLLQEFNIEIPDKKGAENLAADHLSRLENPDLEKLTKAEIKDLFPEELLMEISDKNNERWMSPFYSNSVLTESYEGAWPKMRQHKFFDYVIADHLEDMASPPPQEKSSRSCFTGYISSEMHVCLFHSRLRLFLGKLKSRWYRPFSVCKDMKNGAIELYDEDGNGFIVNKQRVKPYQKSVLDTNKDDDITLDDEGEVT
ncbi:hypothetical protein Tco_0679583 [Tanacetum coccineum]|uniref:Reverse transcriptase domain-containing protein n=1 Tax=Tanacetum coccineum TaxID=301880 RepID=A0ABQ4XI95_9ASTR